MINIYIYTYNIYIFIGKNTTACFAVKALQVFLIQIELLLELFLFYLNKKYLKSLNGETGCSIFANKDIYRVGHK